MSHIRHFDWGAMKRGLGDTYLTNINTPVISISLEIPFHDLDKLNFCLTFNGSLESVFLFAIPSPFLSTDDLFWLSASLLVLLSGQPILYVRVLWNSLVLQVNVWLIKQNGKLIESTVWSQITSKILSILVELLAKNVEYKSCKSVTWRTIE